MTKRNTKVVRIPIILDKKLKKLGGGKTQKGIEKMINICESVKKNPEEICMNHISDFMLDVREFYGDNHFEHMKNLPTAVLRGLRHGGNCDFSIMNKRPEKVIDKFTEEKQ